MTARATSSMRTAARRGIGRRGFLRSVQSAVAAGLSASALAGQGTAEAPSPVDKEALKGAEEIVGLSFTDAEEGLMLRSEASQGNLKDNREYYETIRQLPIPADTEPAFSFRPPLPRGPRVPRRIPAGRPSRGSRASVRSRPNPPASLEELAFLPVAALASLVESRTVSSVDLTRMYLDRLRRYDKALKTVITLTDELALAQAAEADREIRAGRYRGPLHGIPWGVKDLFATRGIRTTWGAKPYAQQMIDEDASAVVRLREAGAVLVAKLSTGELAYGDVWFGGRTLNPWNRDRGAGGSSAGPASATAAGLVGFSLGTDTGGSIIGPAGGCGAVGLRPTYGRVSRHGVMPLRWTLDRVGPICRAVEDCALVLDAIHGPDGHDETVADLPFAWQPDARVRGLRIGYVEEEFERPSGRREEEDGRSRQHRAVLRDALDVFRRAGAQVEPMLLPEVPERALFAILGAEAGAMFDDLLRSGDVQELARQTAADRPTQLRSSRFIPAVEYIQAQRIRTLLIRRMNDLFERYDVFLAPSGGASVRVANLTGHPTVTLKAGFVGGLPQAILVTGRLYEEATLLQAALAYERATTWSTMHPDLG